MNGQVLDAVATSLRQVDSRVRDVARHEHNLFDIRIPARRNSKDDSIRIQRAINNLPDAGGTVLLGPGEFTFKNPVLGKSNINIRGSGKGITRIKQADNALLSTLIDFPVAYSGFSVEDLTIDGNQSNNNARCIALSITSGSHWAVRRVEIAYVSGPASPGPPGACLATVGFSTNYTIEHCWIHDSGVPGGSATDGLYTAGYGGSISHNLCEGISDTAIVYEAVGGAPDTPSTRTVIDNNIIVDTVNGIAVDAAIAATYGAGCTVSGNVVERFGLDNVDAVCAGIYILKGVSGGYQIDVAVTGNITRNSTHARGLRLEGVSDIAVTGHIATFCSTVGGLEGIGAFGCERLSITGGIVKDNGGWGVGLQGCPRTSITSVVFWGNSSLPGFAAPANIDARKLGSSETTLTITACQITNATAGFGVQLADATKALISGNDVTDNPSGPFNNASTGEVRFGFNRTGNTAHASGILCAQAAIDFPSIGAGISAEASIAVPGTSDITDTAEASPFNGIEAGLVWSAYPITDAVVVRILNFSAAPIDPVNRTWRVVVTKGG